MLLGDAAAPFGVNAAMEGATVLDQCIGRALRASPQPPDRAAALARAALEYDRLWRAEAAAMRVITQGLDLRRALPWTLRDIAYALVGCCALHSAKDGALPYSSALRRQRALDGVLLCAAAASTAAALVAAWRLRRPQQ